MSVVTPEDAEAIERATLKALPPRVLIEDDGWLLSANDGAIGRANSVTPLAAGRDPLDAKIERALAFYAERGLRAQFRLSPYSRPDDLADALTARGFAPDEPTAVMTRDLDGALAQTDDRVDLLSLPDDAWRALFLGPGVDATKGAIRAETLARGEGTAFAQIREGNATLAVGAVSIDGAWAGVHGMRTAAAHRGKGHGRAVLDHLIGEAHARGARRLFLQVEEVNTGARRLYERAGFAEAYGYSYWRAPR